MAKDEVRIDKFMWATRIFKTRTIATEACKKGRVMLDGVAVKPSRMIKVGDVIQVRKPPVTYSFRVLALSESEYADDGFDFDSDFEDDDLDE